MAKNKKKSESKVKNVIVKGGKGEIKSDVDGSYTGVPTESEDLRPIQDADDL